MDKKHEVLKRRFQIIGKILLPIGVMCMVIAFANIFISAKNFQAPSLFFLFFLGIPLVFAGTVCLSMGYNREMMRYGKNEKMPILKEAAPEIKEIFNDVFKGNTFKCQRCGEKNDEHAKFCTYCGVELKTSCPICGTKTNSDDNYCNKCGARLK